MGFTVHNSTVIYAKFPGSADCIVLILKNIFVLKEIQAKGFEVKCLDACN